MLPFFFDPARPNKIAQGLFGPSWPIGRPIHPPAFNCVLRTADVCTHYSPDALRRSADTITSNSVLSSLLDLDHRKRGRNETP